MGSREAVTVFVRHAGEVLLVRPAGSAREAGHWTPVTGIVGEDVESAIDRALRETIGVTDWTLVRRGDPQVVETSHRDGALRRTPVLVTVPDRSLELDRPQSISAWVHPSAICRRPTRPGLWDAYARVGPTVETVAQDTAHGSRALSLRALGALRDAARSTGTPAGPRDIMALLGVARELATARPAMAAVTNRIDRAVTRGIGSATPTGIELAAIAVHDESRAARERIAHHARPWIDGRRVATLSRSGTVMAALRAGAPAEVVVAESRPGGEGQSVAAERASAGDDVTLIPDAAMAAVLAERIETLLVGADAIDPDGTVLNKVGTRGGAIAAARSGVDIVVVTASDAVRPASTASEASRESDRPLTVGHAADKLDGPPGVERLAPLFDRTPPGPVTRIVTEHGGVRPAAVEKIADRLAGARAWRETTGESGPPAGT